MAYEIRFAPQASRDLRGLDHSTRKRLTPAIDSLADEPRPRGVSKLTNKSDLYRVRVGDYRIVYEIQDRALIVLVVRIAHRSEVYRGR